MICFSYPSDPALLMCRSCDAQVPPLARASRAAHVPLGRISGAAHILLQSRLQRRRRLRAAQLPLTCRSHATLLGRRPHTSERAGSGRPPRRNRRKHMHRAAFARDRD